MKLVDALNQTGIATITFDDYTAGVEDDLEGGYSLWVQKEMMPPHFRKHFDTLLEVEEEMHHSFFPEPFEWQPVEPEES